MLLAAGKEELSLEPHHEKDGQEIHILETGVVIHTSDPNIRETH